MENQQNINIYNIENDENQKKIATYETLKKS